MLGAGISGRERINMILRLMEFGGNRGTRTRVSPAAPWVKNPLAMQETRGDVGSVPGLGRSPGK